MTKIIWQDQTGSTNDDAKAYVAQPQNDEAEPLWIAAIQQTKGRGRQGRIWQSPPGNLYASWLGRWRAPVEEAAQFSFLAALAVRDTVRMFFPKAAISLKWPNDVLLEQKKFCGILLELVSRPEAVWLVVGIGVNIKHAPEDTPFPATALGLDITPQDFLQKLAHAFDTLKDQWHKEGFAPIRVLWLDGAHGLGEGITVRLPHETLSGKFETLTENGALILQTISGERVIEAGDVFFTKKEQ